jgi:hypothetical protein
MKSAVIVALPIGKETVTYNDGDTTSVHQTLVYLGDAALLPAHEASKISAFVEALSYEVAPVTGLVIGKGVLGPEDDRMVLTESEGLTAIRQQLIEVDLIREVMDRVGQHPNWISHVSGMQNLKYGNYILFDRLAFWWGDMRSEYYLSRPAVFYVED